MTKYLLLGGFGLAGGVAVVIAALVAGCKKESGHWVPIESPEFHQRVKVCADLGLAPIIELWRGLAAVTGCTVRVVVIE